MRGAADSRVRSARTLWRLALAGGVVAAVVALARWSGVVGLLTVEGMRATVQAWGPLGPFVFIAIFVAGFFVPGPELLFAALGGVLFGGLPGFAYAYVASMIGTSATFLLVRYTAQGWAQRALHARFPQLAALDQRLERHGVVTITLLRLVLFLSPPLNWALGASRVATRDYLLGTAVGVAPGLAIAVSLGDALGQTESGAELWRLEIVLPAALVIGFLAVAAMAGRRLLARAAFPERDVRRRPGEA